jgi:hypothetical protein
MLKIRFRLVLELSVLEEVWTQVLAILMCHGLEVVVLGFRRYYLGP